MLLPTVLSVIPGMFRGLLHRLKSRSPQAMLLCKDPHHYPIAARVADIPSTVAAPIVANRYFPLRLLKWWDHEIDYLRGVNREALEGAYGR